MKPLKQPLHTREECISGECHRPQEKPPVMSQAYQPPCEHDYQVGWAGSVATGGLVTSCVKCGEPKYKPTPKPTPLVPVEELTLWSVEPLHDLQAKLNEVVKRLNILANK